MKLNFLDTVSQDEKFELLSGVQSTNVSVIVRKKDGTELFKDLGPNATLVGGVQEYVKNMWGIQSSDLLVIPNLDSEFQNLPTPTYTSDRRVVFGYGLGIDGTFGNAVNVVKRHDVGYKKDSLVAFQTLASGLDDPATYYRNYAFRTEEGGDTLYYIKKFVPEYKVVSAKSKTKVPDTPHKNYTGTEDVRVWCRIKATINIEECKRWFGKKYGTTDNAYFNSIILFAGRPCTVTINGNNHVTYRDIVATNKINFKNIQLNDSEIIFNYDIYFV